MTWIEAVKFMLATLETPQSPAIGTNIRICGNCYHDYGGTESISPLGPRIPWNDSGLVSSPANFSLTEWSRRDPDLGRTEWG
jgi:hypothetical protein